MRGELTCLGGLTIILFMHYSLLLLLGFGINASATILLRSSAMYMSSSSGGLEASRMTFDVNPAFVREKGWAFGATYQMDQLKNGPINVSTTSMGPSVGLMSTKEFGFFGVGTYFVKATRTDQREGSGYQFDLGYRFKFRHLSYAMQASYKHYSFKPSGDAKGENLEVSHLDPYFGLWYEF